MAKFPIGKGSSGKSTGNAGRRPRINLDALTKKARYIVDDAGRRQSVVVDYATWQKFLHQVGESGVATGAATDAVAADSEYSLYRDQASDDLYRPKPASRKEAADFRLEANVVRRED